MKTAMLQLRSAANGGATISGNYCGAWHRSVSFRDRIAVFKIGAGLKHGNIGSSPHWIDPPMTDLDRFWISFPVSWFFYGGAALLLFAIVRAIAAPKKN
jgi:hypothetical protein